MEICFDCSSGVSGDMIVGALLDLGANKNKLMLTLKSLNLTKYQVCIKKIEKNGVFCTDFDVILSENNYDHDLNYLYGNKKVDVKITEKRTLKDIKILLQNSLLSDRAQKIALKIFETIALAEGKAHSLPPEEVIFHESGAMDSIIDIASIAFCLDDLKVTKVYYKNLHEGHGFINTRVGRLPVPTPAVQNIVNSYLIPLKIIDFYGELITPTGIAALAVTGKYNDTKNYKILKTGYGAGKRNYDLPCVLKVEQVCID